MTVEHPSARYTRIVQAVERLCVKGKRDDRNGTLCSDVATFLNKQPGLEGVSEDDVIGAFKRPGKKDTSSYRRSIAHYNLYPADCEIDELLVTRTICIEQPPQPVCYYLGEATFPDVPNFNPRAPYDWLHQNLQKLSNQYPQGLPFSIVRQAMKEAGVYQHAPGVPMCRDEMLAWCGREIEHVVDFARIAMIMEGGDKWPMMTYEDVPLPSATADPRQRKTERGIRWQSGLHLDVPSRDRLKIILCRDCDSDEDDAQTDE